MNLTHNFIANLSGNLVAAVTALAAVPVYVGLLGIESYGLIGFYTTLTAALSLLDLGLTPTITRELARRQDAHGDGQRADLARTLEVVYWATAAIIGVSLYFLAPLLTGRWLRSEELSPREMESALRMMAVGAAAQWPLSFYHGGMHGLNRQVLLNSTIAIGAIARAAGAIALLTFVSARTTTFFAWQAVASLVQVAALFVLFWRQLGGGSRARFRRPLLRQVCAFAAGMSLTAALGFALRQSDKVVLSRLLPLEMFGVYMLGATLASGLSTVSSAVFKAVFPRLAAVVRTGPDAAVRQEYQRGSEVAAALNAAIGGVCAIFAAEVIWAWSGNPALAAQARTTAAILVFGTALNGMAGMPYELQVAHGWTSLGVWKNVLAVLIIVPVTIVLALHYGAEGAAFAWVLLNVAYLAVEVPIVHHYLLAGHSRRWYRDALVLPLASAFAVCLAARVVLPVPSTRAGATAMVVAVAAAALVAVVAATPSVRNWVLAHGYRRPVYDG